eukprot:Em0004g1352a
MRHAGLSILTRPTLFKSPPWSNTGWGGLTRSTTSRCTPTKEGNGVPAHWHYISFGFSDLHGDGRVHERSTSRHMPSGYGFELTFRLKREACDKSPPTWPAELMQSLARYVFKTENALCEGDHISWHSSLDKGDSRIQHMLLCQDPQLSTIDTPLGYITFVQIVGVTEDELSAAQRWNGPGVLKLLMAHPQTGGTWLVTNMRRGESLFDVDINADRMVQEGVRREGSNLSGVSAMCAWEDADGRPGTGLVNTDLDALGNGLLQPHQGAAEIELMSIRPLEYVHIKLNLEAANVLPLAIQGRLRHGRHFTYKSLGGDVAITLVCAGVQGALVTDSQPIAAHGPWVQIFISESLMDRIVQDFGNLLLQSSTSGFHWEEKGLRITVLSDWNTQL